MIRKLAFTLYPVTDLERAKKFYEKHFHLKPSKVSADGAWLEYDLPEGGCFALTTLAKGVKPSANAGGSMAFEVDNLDELVANLKVEKITIPLDIFSSPVCRMAVILDSEGNSLILHQLKK